MTGACGSYRRFSRLPGAERNYSRHTVTAYARDLGQFREFLAMHARPRTRRLAVDRLTLRLYLGVLSERGIQKRSVARKLAAIRSFFRFLVKRKGLAVNPAGNLVSPKLPKKLPSFLDEPSVHRMMDLPDTATPAGLRDRAVLELLYGTGIRVGELTGLTIAGLDLPAATIRVRGKGSKERILPLGERARAAMRSYLAPRNVTAGGRKDGRVFVNSKGSEMNRREIYRSCGSTFARLGDRPEELRTCFATRLPPISSITVPI